MTKELQPLVPGTDYCPCCYVASSGKIHGDVTWCHEEERNIQGMVEVWCCEVCYRTWEVHFKFTHIHVMPQKIP